VARLNSAHAARGAAGARTRKASYPHLCSQCSCPWDYQSVLSADRRCRSSGHCPAHATNAELKRGAPSGCRAGDSPSRVYISRGRMRGVLRLTPSGEGAGAFHSDRSEESIARGIPGNQRRLNRCTELKQQEATVTRDTLPASAGRRPDATRRPNPAPAPTLSRRPDGIPQPPP
jgi:hypothetical protein